MVNGKSLKQVVKLRAFRLETGNRKEWDTRGSENCKTPRARVQGHVVPEKLPESSIQRASAVVWRVLCDTSPREIETSIYLHRQGTGNRSK